jgi:hypothetical protein
MTTNSQEPQEVEAYSLIWGEAGVLFRVPQPVIEPYRLSAQQWAEIETSMSAQDKGGSKLPEGAEYIHAIPHNVLEPYRLTEADVSGYQQVVGNTTGLGGAYMVAVTEGRAARGDWNSTQQSPRTQE